MAPVRSCTVAAVFLLALLLAMRPARGELRYNITALRAIQAATVTYATPAAINDNGIVVGSDRIPNAGTQPLTRAVQWDAAGTMTMLPLASGTTQSDAFDINNAGVVVGYTNLGSGTQATRWAANGTPTVLPGLPANGFTPSTIASTIINDGRMYGRTQGKVVEFKTDAPRIIINDGSQQSFPQVNDSGRIIGERLSNGWRTFQLEPTVVELPFFIQALDMNDRGELVGNSYVAADGTLKPWSLRLARGYAINDRGDAVGTYNTADPSANSAYRAFAYINGAEIPLASRISDTRWELEQVYDINNRGQIVGVARFDHDSNPATPVQRTAYRLDPIRTPGDTNYDNAINFADLVTLAQSYNKSGNGTVFWETGDFNFDWKVDFADLVALAQNYGRPASFAADWALAQSLVPEPAALGMLSVFTLALFRCRVA